MADKVGCLLILIFILALRVPLNAQNLNDEKDRQIEQVIESMTESGNGEDDCPLIIEDLTRYSENPLNINTASAEELERLNIIDFIQIQNIIAYRKQYGYILSPYELNAVDGLTPELIKALEPFVSYSQPSDTIKTKRVYQKMLVRGKTSFPFAKGYSSAAENKPAAYSGIPAGFYSRYSLEIPGNLEVGFITDHDAGEDFFKGTNPYGFDYYSGFISWQGKSFIHQIILGDYYLRFGQGLNFWSGSGIGKSANVMNIFKSGQGIRPYTSTDENQFFRGIATVLGKGPLKLTLFYSNKIRDANTTVDKNSGEQYFTSLETSGYHRTSSEIEDEKILPEQDAGAYGELRLDKFRLGAQFSYQHFRLNMITGTAAYKAKNFSGNENFNTGIDYQLALHRLQLFGEAGMSMNLKPAVVQGLIWHAHPQFNLSLYYRYFDPGYYAFYANALSEGSGCRNERGFYTGVELNPLPKVKVSSYTDFYHFPWLTYSTLASSSGRDIMVQVDYSLLKNLDIYLQGKSETKSQKSTIAAGNPSDYDETTNKLRLNCEWRVNDKLMFKSRVEYAGYFYHNLTENGYLALQDMVYSPDSKIELWFRYAYFHTDGYNSRIYTYENDLLYSFAIPEFYGEGHRIYLNLKWKPLQNLTTYIKVGYTLHAGKDSWGSGNDMTMGNNRTELRGEMCLRF
jgi:hypothetical protein